MQSGKTKLEEIYKDALKALVEGQREAEIRAKNGANSHELDCLFHPEAHPVVWKFGDCSECTDDEKRACADQCEFDALSVGEDGEVHVNQDECVACTTCIDACKMEKLQASKDIIPALQMLLDKGDRPVYALVAPAFNGQFPGHVSPGQLRTAFGAIGFDGMIEVALFADILTLKEALEFTQNVKSKDDFQLTSCCCPMWIALIRRVYNKLMPHVPGAVSPMIAAGRAIKQLNPKALTIFIGPCVAKKAEAREKDLKGAIDYVLTFQEMQDIFEAMEVKPEELKETWKDHSSRAGRIYARIEGVCEAVSETVKQLDPEREVKVRPRHADGIPACKKMLAEIQERGDEGFNFFEGMGCVGGCVGGPKAVLPVIEGTVNVDRYGYEAQYKTPVNNPYVLELLHRLGFETIHGLLEHSEIFNRDFN